jgi:hypothetical protein
MSDRRDFLQKACATCVGAATIVYGPVRAQAAKLEESDATATALHYKMDNTKVDKAKFPKFAVDQNCANCMLYTGKAGEPMGPCGAFGGKAVTAKGWCSAWVKKPA